ncbi:Uncharacterised protein [Mycobacteroides abscessus subsp. abscessus]|nr:Uncharacterised protein [Mycobacteroides abscessus subsp. abscessus]
MVVLAIESSPGRPRSRFTAGAASRPSTTTLSSRVSAGARPMSLATRMPLVTTVSSSGSCWATNGSLGVNRNRPSAPSSAGIRVRATSTANAAATAPPRPMKVRNRTPTMLRPASAMMTVRPANTTAEPAVPNAVPAASSGESCTASSCL